MSTEPTTEELWERARQDLDKYGSYTALLEARNEELQAEVDRLRDALRVAELQLVAERSSMVDVELVGNRVWVPQQQDSLVQTWQVGPDSITEFDGEQVK